MTESQRLDRYASFATYDSEPVTISDEQFCALERAAKRRFDSVFREKIQKALYFYVVHKDRDILASTLEDQSKILRKFQDHVQGLYDIFNLADPSLFISASEGAIRVPGWHAAFRTTHRIEDALIFDKAEHNEILWGDFYLDRPREMSIDKTKELLDQHQTEPLVDLKQFQISLNWLRLAGKRAAAWLDAECKADKGARETNTPLDGLLVRLDDIYEETTGKGGGKLAFIYQAFQLIPERIRPDYPEPDYISSNKLKDRLALAKRRHKQWQHTEKERKT